MKLYNTTILCLIDQLSLLLGIIIFGLFKLYSIIAWITRISDIILVNFVQFAAFVNVFIAGKNQKFEHFARFERSKYQQRRKAGDMQNSWKNKIIIESISCWTSPNIFRNSGPLYIGDFARKCHHSLFRLSVSKKHIGLKMVGKPKIG